MRYITETRNLFDINSSPNLNNNSNITINGNSILCVAFGQNAHVSYRVPTVIGEKYTVSNKSVVKGGLVNTGNFCLFLSDNPNVDSSNYLTYGLQSGQSFTFTASSEFLYIHWYVCYNFDSNNPSTIEINELQVNLGDTATPYVPYGYLPMRRMKYKSNNVCQLLDKSKYPATQTINGVTFTKVDGGYQLNGTCTRSNNLYIIPSGIPISKGHKYLVLDNRTQRISNNYTATIQFISNDATFSFGTTDNMDEGVLFTNFVTKDNICSMRIRIDSGVVYNNVVLLPQLFDLTEMYGAGHEPTTIEEFRQDYPNELYEYSPYCWAPMKNIRYLDTTKNLLDISKVTKTDKLKVIGNSIYCYGYPVVVYDTSTLSIFKSLKPNTNYTTSAITNYLGNSTTSISLIFNNGDWLNVIESYESGFAQTTFSLTQEQIDNIKAVYFYGLEEERGGPVIWGNIQIEEGNTATDYVPYGYLPLK